MRRDYCARGYEDVVFEDCEFALYSAGARERVRKEKEKRRRK
jgi:hypothetical protein